MDESKGGLFFNRNKNKSMVDLTRILKVGDRVWCAVVGESIVTKVDSEEDPSYPIHAISVDDQKTTSYTKYGQLVGHGAITLYPIGQKPEAPNWPKASKTFEWEGETYKEGEWVAVRDYEEPWIIAKFAPVEGVRITRTEYGDFWRQMRKLSSFNQP